MKTISSISTAFYKKVFPAVWFGFRSPFLAALGPSRGAVYGLEDSTG
jgi:hypothetical protein